MLQSRRSAFRLSRHFRPRRSHQRRYDSTNTPSEHAADAGHAAPTHHGHHPAPVNESFGRGFYITVAALPLSLVIYQYMQPSVRGPDNLNPVTRMIKSFSDFKTTWEERAQLHTQAIEQAAFDRNLFQNSPGSRMVDLSFPEVFNTGSPYNVPAGHQADLREVAAHYNRQNAERQKKQHEYLARYTAEQERLKGVRETAKKSTETTK